MSAVPHINLSVRAQLILEEISGVVSLYNINQKEVAFLNSLVNEQIVHGSKGQIEWLDKIEDKVFEKDTQND